MKPKSEYGSESAPGEEQKTAVIVLFQASMPPRQALMLRSLKAQGWRIVAVAWDRSGGSRTHKAYDGIVDKWEWVQVEAPTWSARIIYKLPRYYYELRRTISKMPRIDLLILCHAALLPVRFFAPGKCMYEAAEMHSLESSFYFGRLRKLAYPIIRTVEGMLVSRVDGITTVDSKGGWLEKYFLSWNKRVTVIWNTPSLTETADPIEIESLAKRYCGRKVVAFVGGLMREKGLRVAIEAAGQVVKEHKDALFLFIGPLKDDRDALDKLIAQNGVQSHLLFLDSMPYRQMLAHLAHARIGLALHQRDRIFCDVAAGNGRKFYTYMQAGLAIIGPSFGEVGRSVEMADCGLLVDTESVKAVADAISFLLARPEVNERMASNGQKAFQTRFNWEAEEGKFLSFINQVAG